MSKGFIFLFVFGLILESEGRKYIIKKKKFLKFLELCFLDFTMCFFKFILCYFGIIYLYI